jgi:hypothetical protein
VVVSNRLLQWIDPLGLSAEVTVDQCNITIFVGHGLLDSKFDDDGKLKNPEDIDKSQVPPIVKCQPCSGATVIACNSGRYCQIETPIKGYEPPSRAVDWMDDIVGEINKALVAARTDAKNYCKPKGCCDSVNINVKCTFSSWEWLTSVIDTKDGDLKKLCNREVEPVPCP